ncbi:hypothetical protein IV203_029140 [Nitzschia inconspicua]|uniref:Uncharacterized protein n=1 Tax=Nitzschia inconspicua TaxID=303405 RepID=A0A9K3LQ24_9STRA|nr:hypothetical protein IV203_029140 [Nitzschia inconspicua]
MVTDLSECSRRFGSSAKTKILEGVALESISMKNQFTNRIANFVRARYGWGDGHLRDVTLRIRSVEVVSETAGADLSPVAVPLPVPSPVSGPAVAPALSPPTPVAAATLPPTPAPATAPAVALQSPPSFQLPLLVELESHGAVSMTSGPVFDGETSPLSARAGCPQNSIAGCWSMTLWKNLMSIWFKRLILQNTFVLMNR